MTVDFMRKKVAILGAGKVGATTAQRLAYTESCDILLWDRTEGVAKGIALDIKESSPLDGFDSEVEGTSDIKEIKKSEIIIMTAGAPRKEGQSRDDLLKTNAAIVKDLSVQIKRYSPDSKLIVLTNPLDAMVYLAKQTTGFPRERIMGMAGILDSARFRTFISDALKVSVSSVNGMVLGGHGDFMVPLPKHSSVNGIPITDLLTGDEIKKIVQRTRDGGAEIINLEKKSSAYYAPASSLALMAESILKDKKMVLPCAAYLNGEYGIKGIFMGVPVIIGEKGVEKIIELDLTKQESQQLKESSAKIHELIKQFDRIYK
jgi:malate dehydrogenase